MASNNPTAPAADGKPMKPAIQARPKYSLIHKDPLPVKLDPLPPLIPHNPLSVLTIAWVFLRSWLRPVAQPVYTGIFSPETRSVHITDEAAIRALWEAGFFGKGTLSRSEPTWLDREKRRRGIIVGETSEEITRKRRLERKQFKVERARKEREEIELRLKRERGEVVEEDANAGKSINDSAQTTAGANGSIDLVSYEEGGTKLIDITTPATPTATMVPVDDSPLVNLEHLQLTLEEAFFLAFGLGVLQIVLPSPHEPDTFEPIPQSSLFSLFRAYSTFPPSLPSPSTIWPTNPFVLQYAAYHHFRSKGWVVRPGTKFAVDWMIYNRGPVFTHAEFAVIVVPSYSSKDWKTEEGRKALREARVRGNGEEGKTWHWLHMVNRVQAQVRKTLVLAFVEMPPPMKIIATTTGERDGEEDPTSVFGRMKVREVVLRRWIANRNRD